MAGPVTRFLGDSPWRVAIKLVVVSFLVGFVMQIFGWTPLDVWYAVREAALDVWYLGFDAFGRFIGYILLGAAIVIPAFVVLRLLSFRR